MYQITNDSMYVTRDLLMALGLALNENNVVIDQESKNILTFEDKTIKANTDPDKVLYIGEYDIRFDPLNPACTNIMEKLFGKFLDDCIENGSFDGYGEMTTFFFDRNDEDETYSLTIKFSIAERLVSKSYHNKILCYSDLVFLIDGTFKDKDLSKYDIIEED